MLFCVTNASLRVMCLVDRSLPTLWVGTSGGLVCVYEFTLGSTTDVEQSPPLKCVLGKPFKIFTNKIILYIRSSSLLVDCCNYVCFSVVETPGSLIFLPVSPHVTLQKLYFGNP